MRTDSFRVHGPSTSHQHTQHAAAGLTFSPHADFEALLQAAVLTLVPVVLVDGAVPVPPAGVRKVPPHRALKEAFAALAGELAVMFPTGLVPADHAVHVGELVSGKSVVPRGGTVGRPWRPAGFLATYLELGARVCRNVLWPLTYYHCHANAAKFWSPFKPQRKSDLIKDPFWRLGSDSRGRASRRFPLPPKGQFELLGARVLVLKQVFSGLFL